MIKKEAFKKNKINNRIKSQRLIQDKSFSKSWIKRKNNLKNYNKSKMKLIQ